jgi:hypothetical protein
LSHSKMLRPHGSGATARACALIALLASLALMAAMLLARGRGGVAGKVGDMTEQAVAGDNPPLAVIVVLSTAARVRTVMAGWRLWGNASLFPVIVVTDSRRGLEEAVEEPARRGRMTVWTPPCAPDHGAGLCCKTAHFVDAAPRAFPAARWFLRVTDDTLVDTAALAELLKSLGPWALPRTIGHRLTPALTFDVVRLVPGAPPPPPASAGGREYITGGAMLVSVGALTDPRLPAALHAACARVRADDAAWGIAGAGLGWPRPEPCLAMWNYAPTADLEGGRGGCQPWYLCAPRAAGLAGDPTSWAPSPRVPTGARIHVAVAARPVTFHVHGGLIEKGPGILAALRRDGVLSFEVDRTRGGGGGLPGGGDGSLDGYYAAAFAGERAACSAAQARARVELGRPAITFPCDSIGSFGCHCERATPCGRYNVSGQPACLMPTQQLGVPIMTLPAIERQGGAGINSTPH